jgi:hypothetical protein
MTESPVTLPLFRPRTREHLDEKYGDCFMSAVDRRFRRVAAHSRAVEDHYRCRLGSGLRSRRQFLQAAGELLAAIVLQDDLGFSLQFTELTASSRYDFGLTKQGVSIAAEAKTLVADRARRIEALRLRRVVKEACDQFPACGMNLVVVTAYLDKPITHHLAGHSLYGDQCYLIPVPRTETRPPVLLRHSRLRYVAFSPSQNTRVGAVMLLTRAGSYVIHNCYARTPLPSALFTSLSQYTMEPISHRLVEVA